MDSANDFELIEEAEFTTNIKMAANAVVSSLRFLKSLAVELGIPIEQITAEHVIREFSEQDAKIQALSRQLSQFRTEKELD